MKRAGLTLYFIAAMFSPFVIAFAIFGFVIATGQTIGQRCERAFQGDLAAQERCVYEMRKGLRPYPTAKAADFPSTSR